MPNIKRNGFKLEASKSLFNILSFVYNIQMIKKIKKYPSDITQEQFEYIRPILESARRKTNSRKYDLYDVWNAVN